MSNAKRRHRRRRRFFANPLNLVIETYSAYLGEYVRVRKVEWLTKPSKLWRIL